MRQGRTDAWIAHQLEVTVQQIQTFRREHGLTDGSDGEAVGVVAGDYDDEIDLRAEDDALIAAELEAAEARAEDEGPESDSDSDSDPDSDSDSESRSSSSRRRRGRRGGRRTRRKDSGPLEATFEHGDEGYGLWLDPGVQDDPVYAEYWAGHRPVEVTIEEDQIVIRRAGEDSSGEDDEESDAAGAASGVRGSGSQPASILGGRAIWALKSLASRTYRQNAASATVAMSQAAGVFGATLMATSRHQSVPCCS